MINAQPVFLCGCSGIRLLQLSGTGIPKQFRFMNSKESLFQQAAQRLVKSGRIRL